MKLLLELRSCCGCAAAPEPRQEVVPLRSAGSGQQSAAGTGRRQLTGAHSSTHWKPGLSAISEDVALTDAERKNERKTTGSEKKESVKTRSPAKRRYIDHGDDYRKSFSAVAFSAFSPAPFLF